MSGSSHERWAHASTSAVSSLTVALFTAAAIMFVTGLATAITSVSPFVRASYYVSTFMMVVFLWVHGLRTARQQ